MGCDEMHRLQHLRNEMPRSSESLSSSLGMFMNPPCEDLGEDATLNGSLVVPACGSKSPTERPLTMSNACLLAASAGGYFQQRRE